MIDEQKQADNTQTQPEEATENLGGEASPATSAEEDKAFTEQEPQGSAEVNERDGDFETAASADEQQPEKAERADPASMEDTSAMEALVLANQALSAQIEDLKSQYARLAADFDNFRKRTQKEKQELDLQVKCNTLRELLPVVDNFERAKEQIKPQDDGEMTIHKAYLSVYKQMVECLKRTGVSAMYPKGEEFDPNLHEAVMREQTEEYPEGTVMDEFRRGYLLGDRVLRHAMVKVAAAPEPAATPEENNPEPSDE